jgi:hypothetical protein
MHSFRNGMNSWQSVSGPVDTPSKNRPVQARLRERSQSSRQSNWHLPWHLNSLPRPPILPPHSGHTQFIMLEIISRVALDPLHRTTDIAHLIQYVSERQCQSRLERKTPRDDWYISELESHYCPMHFTFHSFENNQGLHPVRGASPICCVLGSPTVEMVTVVKASVFQLAQAPHCLFQNLDHAARWLRR